MAEYNQLLARDGKINKTKFFREYVQPRIPNYTRQAFNQFLKRFETNAQIAVGMLTHPNATPAEEENKTIVILKDAAVATREGIARALNIGTDALQEIIEHPELLSPKDRAQLLFLAMKAQDSRIGATAKVRADVREQVKFNKTFSRAAFVGADEN